MDDVERYDLVITDQMMPRLTGSKIATEMLSARPDLPVILMSGYVDEGVSQAIEEIGFASHIKKPFRTERLALTVREVLDKGRGASQ